jgi:hypothetical protein
MKDVEIQAETLVPRGRWRDAGSEAWRRTAEGTTTPRGVPARSYFWRRCSSPASTAATARFDSRRRSTLRQAESTVV